MKKAVLTLILNPKLPDVGNICRWLRRVAAGGRSLLVVYQADIISYHDSLYSIHQLELLN